MSKAKANKDWVRLAQQPGKIERIEAYFSGHGYEPHRHDTYAIGRTLSGVQSFHYRGSKQHSLPGGTMVLHPDEIHDGEAGTNDGFQYRMLYIDPALIQKNPGRKAFAVYSWRDFIRSPAFCSDRTAVKSAGRIFRYAGRRRCALRSRPHAGRRRRTTFSPKPGGLSISRTRARIYTH